MSTTVEHSVRAGFGRGSRGSRGSRGRPWTLASRLGVLLGLILIACFGVDVGVTWDEVFQLEYGTRVLEWFRSGFQDEGALHYHDLYLYGGLFDMLAQWLVRYSPLGAYETRHLCTALVALLAAVGSGKLAASIGGPRAGFIAGVLLVLTPPWLGHGLFNPKDVPFGAAAIFASYAAARLAVGPVPLRVRDVIWAGVSVGIALAVRPGGVFLLAYPLFAAAGRCALELRRRRQRQVSLALPALLVDSSVKLLLVPLLAWLLMLSAWPWAQLDPLPRTLEGIRAASHFHWNGPVLFRGELIKARDLPRSYLPVWFAISLPETYLLALLCGLAACWRVLNKTVSIRGERALAVLVIVVSVLLPLTAALILRPVIYDGQRHFLFLMPPLAALAGVAINAILSAYDLTLDVRRLVGAVAIGLGLLAARDIVALHPYEYVYFNHLSGGLRGALGRFETDYWGASYKEGLQWVVRDMPPPQPGRPIRVSSCGGTALDRMTYHLQQWPGAEQRAQVVDSYRHADVWLAITRFGCDAVPGEVLHVVEREHVPLLYVIRTIKKR